MSWPERVDFAARRVAHLADVGRLAEDLLQTAGVCTPPTPENAVAFLDPGRRVEVKQRPLERGLHGLVARDVLGWIIHLNEGDHPYVQRFTLFHEGFHIIRRSRRLFVDEDYQYIEWLARAFAIRVLMPRRWLFDALKETRDVRRLCARFKVNRPVMMERLKDMGR